MKKWIYNRNGQAVALDCGDSVYDQNGNFVLGLDMAAGQMNC